MNRAPGAWAIAILLLAGGCGKPVLRLADASLGDYYTDKEFKKLSQEQRDEYCQELAAQSATFQADIADAGEALEALRLGVSERRAEIDSLGAEARELENRVLAARAQSRPTKPQGGAPAPPSAAHTTDTYVVKQGDSLWRISGLGETMGRSADWARLYQANQSRIKNPDLIYPGQELVIPR